MIQNFFLKLVPMPSPIYNKTDIAKKFNHAAKNYDNHAIVQKKISTDLFYNLAPYINNNSNILDLGCGTGHLSRLLNEHNQLAKLFELDIAENMLTTPRSYKNNYLVNCDIENLCFKQDSMDLIISSMALQWINNLSQTTKQINKILAKDGRFFASIVGNNSLTELKKSFQRILVNKPAPINNFIDQDYLKQILDNSNFTKTYITKKTYLCYYDNLIDLLNNLKKIGANYTESRTILNKSILDKLSKFYKENYLHNNKLISSWEIFFIECIK